MKKGLVVLSILLVGFFGGKALIEYMSRSANETHASDRVRAFLQGIQPGGDFQKGFGMWNSGGPFNIGNISQDEYNAYVNQLRQWLAQKRIGETISAFEIHEATMVKPPGAIEEAVVHVSCTIDGKSVVMRVVIGERLAWAE